MTTVEHIEQLRAPTLEVALVNVVHTKHSMPSVTGIRQWLYSNQDSNHGQFVILTPEFDNRWALENDADLAQGTFLKFVLSEQSIQSTTYPADVVYRAWPQKPLSAVAR